MGRPRDPQLEQSLRLAAWRILTTEGYGPLTLAKVAADAGAHRTDVYRRWSTKAHLVADAMAEHLPPVGPIDTGSLEGDMRQYVEELWRAWSSPWVDGLVGLVSDLADDAAAAASFRALTSRRGGPLRIALARAADRAEIADDLDAQMVGDLLEGPIMHRRVIGRQGMSRAELHVLADTVCATLRPVPVRHA